jgi:hypothetical protein
MEIGSKNDCYGPNPVEHVTLPGIAVVLSFVAALVLLYILSYPLAEISRNSILSLPLGSTVSFFNTVLGLAGLALIIRYRKNVSVYEFVLAVMIATIICVSIETNYWSLEWDYQYPHYDVYFNGVVTFLMTLGALAMLKAHQVLRVRIAEENHSRMLRSMAIGWMIGFPLGVANVVYLVLIERLPWTLHDFFSCMIISVWPAFQEGIGSKLLLMGLALAIFGKYLPKNVAVATSLILGAFFVPAINASGQLLTSPLTCVVSILVTGFVFGLPIAWLAYRRDIESSISCQWIILMIRHWLVY